MRLRASAFLLLAACRNEPSPVVLERLDAIDNRLGALETRASRLEADDRERGAASALPIDLDPPRAAAGGRVDTKASIAVGKDGIRLNGDLVGPTELTERLAAVHRDNPDVGVIVRADADVPQAKVIEIMDLARKVGIERFSVASMVEEPVAEATPAR